MSYPSEFPGQPEPFNPWYYEFQDTADAVADSSPPNYSHISGIANNALADQGAQMPTPSAPPQYSVMQMPLPEPSAPPLPPQYEPYPPKLPILYQPYLPDLPTPQYVENLANDPLAAPLYPDLHDGNAETIPPYNPLEIDLFEARKPVEPSAPPFQAAPKSDQLLLPMAYPVAPHQPLKTPRVGKKKKLVDSTYMLAKKYTTLLDPAIGAAQKTGRAIGSCSSAFYSTSAELYTLGGTGCLKEAAKMAVGAKYLNSARETAGAYLMGTAQSRANPQQKMGFGEALGTGAAFVGKCALHTMLSGAVLGLKGLYLGGTIYNNSPIGPGHTPSAEISVTNAASQLAFGVNTVMGAVYGAASYIAQPVTKAIISHPKEAIHATVIGATAVGTLSALYSASTNFAKAVEAESRWSKFKHGTKAAAGLATAVALPILALNLPRV